MILRSNKTSHHNKPFTTMNKFTVEVLFVWMCLCQITAALIQCRSCTSAHSLEHCRTDTCQSNQMCYVGDVGHLFTRTHTAHCMTASMCRALTSAVMQYSHLSYSGKRKRTVHMCDICCGSDLCNTKSCAEVKSEMYHLYKNKQLDMHTLTQIPTADQVGR